MHFKHQRNKLFWNFRIPEMIWSLWLLCSGKFSFLFMEKQWKEKCKMMGIPAQLNFACYWLELLATAVRCEEVAVRPWLWGPLIPSLLYFAHRQLPLLFLVLKCIRNRRNSPDSCSQGPKNQTLVSKRKRPCFLQKIRIRAAEAWFHFLQKEVRGKSHVCFLSQFEHVQPSEPNHDSRLRFSSVWAWSRPSCFLLLHFTWGLTWAGNPGCVCGDQSLSYF